MTHTAPLHGTPSNDGVPSPFAPDSATGDELDVAALPTLRRVRRRRHRSWWQRRSTRRRLRIALWVLGGVLVLSVLQLAWAVWNLHAAGNQVNQARIALSTGDLDQAQLLVAQANRGSRRADLGSWGPHLALAEHLPLVGDDIRGIRTVADVSAEATGPVAHSIFGMRETLDPDEIRPIDGQVDLDRFRDAEVQFHAAAGQLGVLDDRLQALPLADMAGPLRSQLIGVVDELHKLRSTADYGDQVLDILPEALGAEGRRRYLVVFQNNAELRTGGGIPGAFAVLQADHGKLEMLDQGSGIDFARDGKKSALPPTDEEQALFDGKVGRWVQDANLTPDWPRSGEMLREMWFEASNQRVDGVISVDPVALSYVLRGSGPVALPHGFVATAQNATQVLINEPYLVLPTQAEQNEFFEDSARLIFDALVTGVGDAGTSLRGMFDAVREGRGYVWLARPEEQEKVLGSVVDGQIARTAGMRPDIGVYFNDVTMTKLQYYVSSNTDVTRVRCGSDGSQTLTMTTTLHNEVPTSVTKVGYSIVGERVSDTPGDLLINVLAYGPIGSAVVNPTINGERGAPATFDHLGHPVIVRTVFLQRGESVKLSWTVATGPDQPGIPVFRTTPGARTSGIGAMVTESCPQGH